jgi:hypothetical protein
MKKTKTSGADRPLKKTELAKLAGKLAHDEFGVAPNRMSRSLITGSSAKSAQARRIAFAASYAAK